MTGEGAGLSGFLKAAGSSLGDAQRQLTAGEEGGDFSEAMAISEVEIEVKATLDQGVEEMELRPVSSQEARSGEIAPDLVSTLRVRYVALPGAGSAPQAAAGPRAAEVVDAVREREDVVALGEIFGDLDFDPVFVPESRDWLVRVADSQGRIVRKIVVPDSS